MIDRIGNGNTYVAPYDRGGKKAARVDGDAPAFLLPGEDENGGVIWDRGNKDDIPRPAAQKKEKEEKKDEYISSREADTDPAEPEEEELKQSGFGKLLGRIGGAIKNFFLSLWYGGDEKNETADKEGDIKRFSSEAAAGHQAGGSEEDQTVSGDNADELTSGDITDEDTAGAADADIERSKRRIQAAIAGNDTDALMEELTEGGKKHPARNTTLLTHYDRRGRLVKPDDSEAGRILRAEKKRDDRNVERRPQGNYRRYI